MPTVKFHDPIHPDPPTGSGRNALVSKRWQIRRRSSNERRECASISRAARSSPSFVVGVHVEAACTHTHTHTHTRRVTRGCVSRGCVDRLARLPAIGPNSVCISPRWQLEVSRVRTRWLRGSLVSRRHLSSCCSLEATANPLSSSSFSFAALFSSSLFPLPPPGPLLQPLAKVITPGHRPVGRRSEKVSACFDVMLICITGVAYRASTNLRLAR